MIEVRAVADLEESLSAANANGIKFGEGCVYITATEKGQVLGHSFIRLGNETVTILSIKPTDFILFDFILRSSLHIAIERGARMAFYENTDALHLYSKLGFIEDKDKQTLIIGKLFESCSCCKND